MGGAYRVKQHLTGTGGDVQPCQFLIWLDLIDRELVAINSDEERIGRDDKLIFEPNNYDFVSYFVLVLYYNYYLVFNFVSYVVFNGNWFFSCFVLVL